MKSDFIGMGVKVRQAVEGEWLVLDIVGNHGLRGLVRAGEEEEDDPLVVCLSHGTKLVGLHFPTAWGVGPTGHALYDFRTPNRAESAFCEGLLVEGRPGHISLQDCPLGLMLQVRALPAASIP